MKTKLLLTTILITLATTFSFSQNLLQNASFEDPGTGKYRGDCLDDGCFNDYVTFWHAPDNVTDSGVATDDQAIDGAYSLSCYNLDGTIYQATGDITGSTDYVLTYWARLKWSEDTEGNDQHYFVTYFYTFDDESNMEIFDSLAILSELPGYNQYEHEVSIPTSEKGRKLAIGFDVKTIGTNGVDPKNCWVRFDAVELLGTSETTGIQDELSKSVSVYPNPTNGMLKINSDSRIDKVELFDLSGKQIYSQTGGDNLDLSGYQKGLYSIRIQTEKNIVNKKITLK